MGPQTVKLLMIFFLATALMNITNYLFYLLYDPPSRQAIKTGPWNSRVHWFTTKRRNPRTFRWTGFVFIRDNPAVTQSTPPNETGDVHGDYSEQSSVFSQLFFKYRVPDICPQKPPGLGPVTVEDEVSLETVEKLYDMLGVGGIYEESGCVARQSVAIIIPLRGPKNEILKFLYSLHPFLMKQQLNYQIFIVEQNNTSTPYNYGMMLNAGFSEAQRIEGVRRTDGWKCLIFHDLQLAPRDTRNLYRCSMNPHQLVTTVDDMSYEYQFGGAIAVNAAQFTKVNGFSNLYSGNEALYDDLYKRFLDANYTVTRSTAFGKYSHLQQKLETNQTRFQTINTISPLNLIDGLSTLTYKLNYVEVKQLYTLVGVDLGSPSPRNNTENIWNRLLNQATMTATKKMASGKVV